MAQHDYVIANDTAANVRSDLNDALSAIVSQNSGASAPSTTYANMLWYDTSNNILKMRSEADDAWINIGYIDQSSNAFRVLDDTQVTNTSGTQTGLLGDQTTATWETGTGTTESLVSPAKVKAAVEANAPESGGMTLLGTLTTTSGTAQTLSGLDLTNYKTLWVTIDDVSHTDNSNDAALAIGDGSSQVELTDRVSGGSFRKTIGFVDLSNGVAEGMDRFSPPAGDSGLRTTSTSITFDWSPSTETFDAGEITVYGMK